MSELLACPYAAAGVVRAAQDHELHVRALCFRFEIGKIDGIVPVRVDKRRANDLPVVSRGGHIHWIIYRREKQHAVAGGGERMYGGKKGVDDARRAEQPLRTDVPAVAVALPAADGGVKTLIRVAVAERALIKKLLQTVHYLGHDLQLHIGDGKRDDALGTIVLFHLCPFHAACAAARLHRFKIIMFHKCYLLLLRKQII